MCWQDVSADVGTGLERESIHPPTNHKGPRQRVLKHAQHPDHNRFFQKTHTTGMQTESSATIPILAERNANLSTNAWLALFIINPGERPRCGHLSTPECTNKGWRLHTVNRTQP